MLVHVLVLGAWVLIECRCELREGGASDHGSGSPREAPCARRRTWPHHDEVSEEQSRACRDQGCHMQHESVCGTCRMTCQTATTHVTRWTRCHWIGCETRVE